MGQKTYGISVVMYMTEGELILAAALREIKNKMQSGNWGEMHAGGSIATEDARTRKKVVFVARLWGSD